MKLIHCADIHLNSSLSTHLDGDKQKQRRTEILHTFLRMVDYAAEQSVDGILIAGDLFDTKKVDRATGNAVLSAITGHPEILFFYLRGNHDADGFLQSLDEIPDNLKLFGDTWRYYAWEEDGATIVITGAESSARNAQTLYTSLRLNPKHINLVMLHGQETPYASGAGRDAEQIPLALLQNKGIDYLALGHIHTYKREQLDARGIYVYPGCLEGRGFDECGIHGFCLLEVDVAHHKIQDTFVPFASRRLWEASVDVSVCASGVDILDAIKETLQEMQVQTADLVKVCLTVRLDLQGGKLRILKGNRGSLHQSTNLSCHQTICGFLFPQHRTWLRMCQHNPKCIVFPLMVGIHDVATILWQILPAKYIRLGTGASAHMILDLHRKIIPLLFGVFFFVFYHIIRTRNMRGNEQRTRCNNEFKSQIFQSTSTPISPCHPA